MKRYKWTDRESLNSSYSVQRKEIALLVIDVVEQEARRLNELCKAFRQAAIPVYIIHTLPAVTAHRNDKVLHKPGSSLYTNPKIPEQLEQEGRKLWLLCGRNILDSALDAHDRGQDICLISDHIAGDGGETQAMLDGLHGCGIPRVRASIFFNRIKNGTDPFEIKSLRVKDPMLTTAEVRTYDYDLVRQ